MCVFWRTVSVCVCVCARVRVCVCALPLTDVVQSGIENGEFFMGDVAVHTEGPAVRPRDVEVLLAQDHPDGRPQGAVGAHSVSALKPSTRFTSIAN